MELEKNISIISAISKKYHLSFCPIFKYYEGDVYVNDKGENLPTYFNHKRRCYKLVYVSGCFNPYLVDKTDWVLNAISECNKRITSHRESKDSESLNIAKDYLRYLKDLIK